MAVTINVESPMGSKKWYQSKKLWVVTGIGALTALGAALAVALESVEKSSAAYVVISAILAIAATAVSYLKAQGGVDAARELAAATASDPSKPAG